MKKIVIALIVLVCFVLSIVPFSLSAGVTLPDTVVGTDERVIALDADIASNNIPEVFGTKAGDGIVWTNKTVTVNEDKFEVTLSALAQEYAATVESEESNSTPADVVMILDISGSMRNNKLTLDGDKNATRTKAMVKAVNEAMEVIMSANPLNRVMIYTFHTDNDINTFCDELLPLGHYTNPSWTAESVWNSTSTNAAKGKYFDYSTATTGSGMNKSTSDKMSTATGLLKDNVTAPSKYITTSSGTCTQQGIITGVNALIQAIGNEEHSVDRLPFVFLFTDGAPGAASKNWYSPTPTDDNRTSHHNNGNSEVTALSVLSASIAKDRLEEAYTQHNGKETSVNWFNLGLTVGDNDQGKAFLNPSTIKDGTNAQASSIKGYIEDYTSGKYSEYSQYASDYVYTSENVTFADTGAELTDAFDDFANLIKESSKEVKVPVVAQEGASATAELVFSEVISKGVKPDSFSVNNNGTVINGTATENEGVTTYSFEGLETTVAVSKNSDGETVLTWKIPAKEIAMYTFADHDDVDNGQYIAVEPLSLSYNVLIEKANELDEERLYVNGFTAAQNSQSGQNEARSTATFTVAKDNPYYYNVTTSDEGAFVSSTLKTEAFSAVAKDKNISETADYISKSLYTAGSEKTTINTLLGNNGTVVAVVKIEKKATQDKVNAGDMLTFTVTVTNLYKDELAGIMVKDTLPEGLTFVSGEANGVIIEESNNVLNITIDSLPSGESINIIYNVKVDDAAATGTVYKNKAEITSLENTTIPQPAVSEVETKVVNEFKVSYSWDGSIPPEVSLPVDNNVYITGDTYAVDSTYQNGHKIDVTDPYGNINGSYVFSGWTDKQGGVMGFENVEIKGLWTYEDVSVETHKVIYNWGTSAPDNVILPVDTNEYVKNQDYTVNGEYTDQTVVDTFDAYGNKNGEWQFSGWTDPNNSVMGENDVTVTGSWQFKSVSIPTHKVIYDWGTNVPENVVLPVDSNEYVKNQAYVVDGTYNSESIIYTLDIYGNQNGKWTFSGWNDPNNAIMGDSNVTVTGSWQFEAIIVPTHKVIYDWGTNVPDDVILPIDTKEYFKNQAYTVNGEHTAQTVIDTFDIYGNQNGKWTFSGWNDPNNAIMGDGDVTIIGQWQFEEVIVPTHKVIYDWGTNLPENVTLPVDNVNYVKNQAYAVDGEYTYQTVIDSFDAYGNKNGEWQFSGWTDPNNSVMGDSDVTIIGNWQFTSVTVPAHKVIYDWGTNVAENVTLPVDSNEYVKNQGYAVDSAYNSETVIYTLDGFGNKNGKWTFSGWNDPHNAVMGDSDVTITGNWQFETIVIPTYKVIYDWGINVPENVTLPVDSNEYVKNQGYAVDSAYNSETVIYTLDGFGNKNGKWTFSGWNDPNNAIMGDSDVKVTGSWQFESIIVPAHKVIYNWGDKAPNSAVLPYDLNEYIENQPYEVDGKYTAQTVVDTFDKYGNKNGEWTFSGWTDPNNAVMGKEDVVITGQWIYTEKTVEAHKVYYSWSGDIPRNTQPPVDYSAYVKGERYTVNKEFYSGFAVDKKDELGDVIGTFIFSGWTDPNNAVMGDSDVTIIGEWVYKINEENKYNVRYDWGEDIPENVKIPIDLNDYLEKQPYSVDGEFTKETEIFTYDERGNKNGKWTFSGWEDPVGGIMGTKNVLIVGKWQFSKITVPEYEVKLDKDTQILENLEKIKVYPNGGVWVYDGTTYKDDQTAVIKVEGNIEISDPTREKFVFDGWDILEEEGYKLVLKAKWIPHIPTTGEKDAALPFEWLVLSSLFATAVLAFAVILIGKAKKGKH